MREREREWEGQRERECERKCDMRASLHVFVFVYESKCLCVHPPHPHPFSSPSLPPPFAHTHAHLCECFQVYLVWFGWEGGSGVFCIIALRNLWSLNALAKTLLLEGGFTQTQTHTHTHKYQQVCCARFEHWFARTECETAQGGYICVCWGSLMRYTEKVLLVEAALGLILPADRASSPPLPHAHTRKHTHTYKLTQKHTQSSWSRLDIKGSIVNWQVAPLWSWKIPVKLTWFALFMFTVLLSVALLSSCLMSHTDNIAELDLKWMP